MSRSLFLSLLVVGSISFSAQAQQSPTVAPSQPMPTEVPPPDADKIDDMPLHMQPPTDEPATTPAGAHPRNPSTTSLSVQPKLNPNSTGSYNKKGVKIQHKQSEKAAVKRRRQTAHYQAVREDGQTRGIRRMEKGKSVTSAGQR